MHCDSQSTIHLIKNQMYHERSRHIDIRYHFIREIVSECQMVVKKIGTNDNSIDMMTKSLSTLKFKHCLDLVSRMVN